MDNRDFSSMSKSSLENLATRLTKPYFELDYGFPVCNHTEKIGDKNIGYVNGIFSDGVPFEAEIYGDDKEEWLSFILPRIFDEREVLKPKKEGNVKTSSQDYTVMPMQGVLEVGMNYEGTDVGEGATEDYLGYLASRNVIGLAQGYGEGQIFQCGIGYFTDKNKNKLTKFFLKMKDEGKPIILTNLTFNRFPKTSE